MEERCGTCYQCLYADGLGSECARNNAYIREHEAPRHGKFAGESGLPRQHRFVGRAARIWENAYDYALSTAEHWAKDHRLAEDAFFKRRIYTRMIPVERVDTLPEEWHCPSGAGVARRWFRNGHGALHSNGCGPGNIFKISLLKGCAKQGGNGK